MSKTKLTLEKFTVSKLNNLSLIIGGNDGDDGTIIKKPKRPRCVEKSTKYVIKRSPNHIEEVSG